MCLPRPAEGSQTEVRGTGESLVGVEDVPTECVSISQDFLETWKTKGLQPAGLGSVVEH